MASASILFIVNPIAGKGSAKAKIIESLQKEGRNIAFTEYRGHAKELAAASDCDIVVAVGGDGTVNEVASGLVGTGKILGIIPCGSGDGLARHLGISHDYARAMETILSAEPQPLDCGKVNGELFFCTCGTGLDATVADRFAKSGQRGLGTYISEALKTWKDYVPQTYTLTVDGVEYIRKAVLITVGNANQWGNNGKVTPRADSSDGLLDVTLVKPFSNFLLPGMVWNLMTGTFDKCSCVESYRGKNISIKGERVGDIHRDGDNIAPSDALDIKVIPAALRVLAPLDK